MNLTPFDNPTSIDCGAFHLIIGAFPKVWNQEIEIERLQKITDNEMIKNYLPDLLFSNEKDAENWLKQRLIFANLKLHLPVIIRLNEPLATIGYMTCYSPLTFDENKEDGYNGWAIEYFIDEIVWGQGVMTAAVQTLLSHLQKCGISFLRASTHKNNIASKRILEKLRFRVVGPDNKVGDHIVYQVKLN